ncbi:MAG: hypothetical protein HDT13_02480 [Butyrivibrio sp.]|nr:hypothetical protein [Butyrivibrio sp.]
MPEIQKGYYFHQWFISLQYITDAEVYGSEYSERSARALRIKEIENG